MNLENELKKNNLLSAATYDRLEHSISSFTEESILRVRRGSVCWEGSNKKWHEPTTFASRTKSFRTASVTKTFTAALVLLLSENRLLALDNPISTYLNNDITKRIHIFEGVVYGPHITIAQLLSHQSGVFDYATDPRFMQHVASSPKKRWAPRDLLNEAINFGAPYFRPGNGVAYSDTGYVLLAMIIEAVTGFSLAAAYKKYLIDPLNLQYTYLEGNEPTSNWPLSHAYAGRIDTSTFDPSFDTFGGGGLVSTAGDLDYFITSLLGGLVFASKDTLQLMMSGIDLLTGTGTRKMRSASGISAFSIVDHQFWGHLGHWNSFMLHSIDKDISICGTFNQAEESLTQKIVLEGAVKEALSWKY